MASEWRYPASPLDSSKNVFRLLYLDAGDLDHAITGTLHEHSLDSPPVFEALSYTWGESLQHKVISVKGNLLEKPDLRVTDNLFAALKHLRHRDRPRVLWTDRICINQDFPYERSQQVLRMGSIFHTASRVLVWLGESKGGYPDDIVQRYGDSIDTWDPLKIGLVKAMHNTRPAWWTRLWVAQEFVRSSHAPCFCFTTGEGTVECSWDELKKILDQLDWDQEFALRDAISSLEKLRARYGQTDITSQNSFAQTIFETLDMDTTDPRDHIYGLLGIVNANDASKLTPDYTLSVADVFREATHRLICLDESLFILSFAISDETWRMHDLPSWGADLRNRSFLYYTRSKNLPYSTDFELHSGIFALGRQHPSNRPHFSLTPDGRTLNLAGAEMDTVLHAVDIRNPYNEFGDESGDTYKQHREHDSIFGLMHKLRMSHLRSRFSHANLGAYKERLHSAAEICTWGERNGKRENEGSGARCLDRIFDAWKAIHEPQFDEGPIYRGASKQANRWLSFGYVPNRVSFFTTRDGMIGIGSWSIQAGDKLVLLYGSPGAAIIHPLANGKCAFRGFPFVYGLLDILHYCTRHEDFAFVERIDGNGLKWLQRKRVENIDPGDTIQRPPNSVPLDFPEKRYALV